MNTIAIDYPIGYLKFKMFELKMSPTISLVNWLLEWKKRKTGEDVFMHSYRMLKKCIQSWIYDELILKSILLHDVIEDSDFTLFNIQNNFGHGVSYIVDAMTCLDDDGEKIKKHIYFEKFKNSSQLEWRVLFVKLFDCIDNLETLHWLSKEKQAIFIKEKQEIFLPIFTQNIPSIPFDFRDVYTEQIQEFKNLLTTKNYEK